MSLDSLVRANSEGRDAIRGALRELETYGYLVREQAREGGRFGEMNYVLAAPGDVPESPWSDYPTTVEPTSEEQPPKKTMVKKTKSKNLSAPPSAPHQDAAQDAGEKLFEDVPLPLDGVSSEPVVQPQEAPVVASRRAPSRPLPEDWEPTQVHHQMCSEKSMNLVYQAQQFRNHAETHDRRCANWNAAFTMWLNKATTMTPTGKTSNTPRQSASSWMAPRKG